MTLRNHFLCRVRSKLGQPFIFWWLWATWPPRTIVKRDPKCMTRENLTGSVGERAFSAAQLGIVTCKCNRGRIIDQDKKGAQERSRWCRSFRIIFPDLWSKHLSSQLAPYPLNWCDNSSEFWEKNVSESGLDFNQEISWQQETGRAAICWVQ